MSLAVVVKLLDKRRNEMGKLIFQKWIRGDPEPTPLTEAQAEDLVGKIPIRNAIKKVNKETLVGIAFELPTFSVLVVRPEAMARVKNNVN